MKKMLVFLVFAVLVTVVSCSPIKREKAMFKRINSEVESCVPSDEGHYEVSLILENGEKFVYHSKDDVNLIEERREISMGYDKESKTYLLAVINPKK